MTDKHPVTPPPELIRRWAQYQAFQSPEVLWLTIATQAANWGADRELEACCNWLDEVGPAAIPLWGNDLRIDRRPKPKSLAEEALKELAWVDKNLNGPHLNKCDTVHTIRRALERLQELEGQGDD